MRENTLRNIIFGLGAFISSFALTLIFEITVRNPLTVVFFVLIFAELKKLDERGMFSHFSVKSAVPGLAVAVLGGTVTCVLKGKELAAGFDSGLFKLLIMMILFAGMSCLFFIGYVILFRYLFYRNKAGENEISEKSGEAEREILVSKTDSIHGKKLFVITFIICMICYLPYFLYEFPGIMTADSLVQYEQIVGIRPWSNHHPVVHTLLIKLFYSIGLAITGDPNTAISFYTVFQMLLVSLCAGRAVCMTDKLVGEKMRFAKWLGIAFYALLPFNCVFAVTLWKDVPFACITVLLICHVIEMTGKSGRIATGDWLVFTLLSAAFCLLRSNAWFAFILWSVIVAIRFRKDIARALVHIAIVFVTVILIKGPVFNAFSVESPDFTESLSVPLQQVAAVLVNDRDVSEKDMELIRAVIDTTYIHELYAPDFADNIKELVRAGHPEVIENNKAVYLGLWLRLLAKYPGDYVKAWFDLVGGYIYPDIPYKVGDVDGIMGNDMGLYWKPLIGGKAVVKAKEILIKMSDFVPLYGMLWCIGAYSWALFISFVLGISRKRDVLGIILLILLIGTLLIASPVVDFRYAYGVILSCPVWIGSIAAPNKKDT